MDDQTPSGLAWLFSGALLPGEISINCWYEDTDKFTEIKGVSRQPQNGYTSLVSGTFVRGSSDDHQIQEVLGEGSFRGTIFSHTFQDEKADFQTHHFLLLPVMPNEGDQIEKRIRLVRRAILFLIQLGEPTCKVILLSGTRTAWRGQSRTTDRYIRETEILRFNVQNGLDAMLTSKVQFLPPDVKDPEDLGFEIEDAVKKANLIVPFDGSAGNLLVRSFRYLSDQFKFLSVPWFSASDKDNLPVGEGGFRKEKDLTAHLKAAALWAQLRQRV